MTLREAHRKAIRDTGRNYPHIYGNAYGELRRQTIWQKIRGIFRR